MGSPIYPREYEVQDVYQLSNRGDRDRFPNLLGRDAGYVWSPDESRVAFSTGAMEATTLIILELDGGGAVRIAVETQLSTYSPSLANVGYVKRLSFVGNTILVQGGTDRISREFRAVVPVQ